ncbi:MAG TPA: fatty acyl-AMP ligase [Blastocatellia bacterium]|nr:fatty acyl-AMP ligase [Blastocatellia bacterium]
MRQTNSGHSQLLLESTRDSERREFETLVHMLRERAADEADRVAFTYLIDGETESAPVTYGQLDRQARAIAADLQAIASKGDRAALLYQNGVEFIAAFFGCLYSGVIAVPLPSVFSPKSFPILQTILADATPRVLLTTESLLPKIGALIETGGHSEIQLMTTDQAPQSETPSGTEDWREPSIDPGGLAYLQYTSGSTDKAKGVMITHRNCLRNLEDLDQFIPHRPGAAVVTWLPHFHDMGLVYGLLEPIYKRLHCYVMPPQSFIQRPRRWLEAISRYRATHSGGPNFAYEHCVRRIEPQDCEGLDLSCWEVAFNGSEPLHKETLDRFARTFAPLGFDSEAFCPAYGLAEATLVVSCAFKEESPVSRTVLSAALENGEVETADETAPGVRTIMASGKLLPATRIAIVDPESRLCCAPGRIGEVWVSNPSVALGYWNRPKETARAFQAHLADTGQGPFLRTGDLGFMAGEDLYITGRIKDLIIIGGRNHYPQDIEATVQNSHPSIRAGACIAMSVEVEREERLVIAAELDRHYQFDPQSIAQPAIDRETADVEAQSQDSNAKGTAPGRKQVRREEIIASINEAVSSKHGVRPYNIVILGVGAIPRTTSGKLQRLECRKRYLEDGLSKLK